MRALECGGIASLRATTPLSCHLGGFRFLIHPESTFPRKAVSPLRSATALQR